MHFSCQKSSKKCVNQILVLLQNSPNFSVKAFMPSHNFCHPAIAYCLLPCLAMLFHESNPDSSWKLCQPLWSKKPRQPSPKPNLWVPLNRILFALVGFRFAGANIPLLYFRRVAQILGCLWSQWWVKSVQYRFTAKFNSGETSNTNINKKKYKYKYTRNKYKLAKTNTKSVQCGYTAKHEVA